MTRTPSMPSGGRTPGELRVDMGRYDVAILCANHFQLGLYQNGAGYRYLELALALRDVGVRAAVVCPGPTDFADCPVPVLDQSVMSPEDIEACANVFIF